MENPETGGIYLIVEFDWPKQIDSELAQKAHLLHKLTQDASWIREAIAGSGGLGGELGSIWVFWLENYAALDRLFQADADPISQAYRAFFNQMSRVHDRIREKVRFL